jgi:hypothetical protein
MSLRGREIFLGGRSLPVCLPVSFVFLCLISLPAWAFEPDIVKPVAPNGVIQTFGAQSLQEGSYAGGINFEYVKHQTYYRFTLGYAYGITNSIELTLNAPYVYHLETDMPGYYSGFEDIGAALKYRFLEQGAYGPSAAVLLMGYTPTGSDAFSREGGVGGGVVLSRRVGPFMGNVNWVYTVPGQSVLKNEWDFLAGLDFSAARNLKMLAELHIRKGQSSSTVNLTEGRFGYRLFTEKFFSTVAVGYDFKDRNPEFRVIVSLTLVGKPAGASNSTR